MEFTDQELQAITRMCGHERSLMDTMGEMVAGLRLAQAQALVAVIASKCEAEFERRGKAALAEKEEPKEE